MNDNFKTHREEIPVVVFGFGNVGKAILRLCEHRPNVRVVGIITRRSKSDICNEFACGFPSIDSLVVNSNPDTVLSLTKAKAVLHCKTSKLNEAFEHFVTCARHGASVVSSCEEFAWPLAQYPALAQRLRKLVERYDVAVMHSGVNPGLIFDKLVLCLAAIAWDIDYIDVRRVIDPTIFGSKIRRQLGLGYSQQDFSKNIENKTIAGHIGFLESATILATKLNLEIVSYDEVFEPIFSENDHELPEGDILSAGQSVGIIHRASASCSNGTSIDFQLKMHVNAPEVGWKIADSIEIGGTHPIKAEINPGVPGIIATAAHMVNSVPRLLQSRPGVYLESHVDAIT